MRARSRSATGRDRRRCRRTATSRWCSRTTRSIRTSRSRRTSASRCGSPGAEARADSAACARSRSCSASSAYLERKPGQLSGGQRQRVAMGRAIVRAAERLPDGRAAVEPRREAARADARRDRVAAGAARRHDGVRDARPVEAMTLGDRVAVLDGGRLQQCDAPRDALRAAGEHVRRRLHRLAVDESLPMPFRPERLGRAGRRRRARAA